MGKVVKHRPFFRFVVIYTSNPITYKPLDMIKKIM